MLQINNKTPFAVELCPYSDLQGRDYAVAIIKGTYRIDMAQQQLLVADEQLPIQFSDDFYGEPGTSSIKYPSDISPVKSATDVFLIGHAYAPNQQAVQALDVTFRIADTAKVIRVFGDRHWQKDFTSWKVSEPQYFTVVPLCYENAYGGNLFSEAENEVIDSYSYNPVGKGYVAEGQSPYIGMPLPNIEDPNDIIYKPEQQVIPVGFGAIGRDWLPRLSLTGTYDEAWQEQRMPLPPLDFNPQFYSSAHPDLQIKPLLRGGEVVSISNVAPSVPVYQFHLPNDKIAVSVSIQHQAKRYIAQLDTILIEPDNNRVTLTWRVVIPCTRKLLYIDSINVERLV